MKKQPESMVVCNLEVLLMPQGEIICRGKTLGWFNEFKEHLSIPKKENLKCAKPL